MQFNTDNFLSLIKLGIGNVSEATISDPNWDEIESLAKRQGLWAILFDGIERIPEEKRPSKISMLVLIGQVMQGFEKQYSHYCRALYELASFYNAHDFRMMVLKGYACGLNWPKPEHRPYGDIDIWLFGEQKEADAILEKEKRLKIDKSHPHHTIFGCGGFRVENHYDFIDIHHHKSNNELEPILKELGRDDRYFIDLHCEKIYLPSPNLHALFLVKHSIEHFSSTQLTIRQVLDWGFYVKKHGNAVDWEWLITIMDKFGMLFFFYVLNAICIEDLGFDETMFPIAIVDKEIKSRVLNDILYPEFSEQEPLKLFPRIILKYRRWNRNKWKHKLCYKESNLSAFISGIWGHILKPASI